MKEIRSARFFLTVALILFFLSPYLFYFKFITFQFQLNYSELYWALKNSFIQSSVSAALSTFLGTFLAFGILQTKPKVKSFLLKLVLLPMVLPTLFSILIAVSIIRPFPMGHIGVVFIFVLMNLGFSIYQMTHVLTEKVGNLALVSEVFGIKKSVFYRRILTPLIWSDLKLNFVFVFLFCLSSLAVPLVAGGGKGTNLEVLIYEKIFIEQNWDVAWYLMLIQTVLVTVLSYFFLKSKSYQTKLFVSHKYIKSKVALGGVLFYLFIYVGGYFYNLAHSLSALDFLIEYYKDIQISLWNSLVLLICLIAISSIILVLWILDYIRNLKHNLAIHFISVSTVLVGFSFYLTFPQNEAADLYKMPLAFTIIFFPSLFKLFFEKKLDQIKRQIVAAKIYGLSHSKILFDVVFKQMSPSIISFYSLLSIWSLSDFAISRSLGTQSETLGLLTENFLTSYRLEAAYLLSLVILLFWLLVTGIIYISIEGFHVSRKKH